MTTPTIPPRHDAVTIPCPACGASFAPTGRQRWCSEACRALGYRRRKQAATPLVIVPKAQPRRPMTIYECDACGARALGEQYCGECRTFMRRIGVGGSCPACDDPVALIELVGSELDPFA
jgi:predicted nucleic acid-binding Zn ribbon protein